MKPVPVIKHCDRCQVELPLGSTKYNVSIDIASDWDGYLPEQPEQSEQTTFRLLEKAARLDEQTLENQVHMELELVLCPACRAQFLDDLNLTANGKQIRKSKPPMRLQ